ESMDYNRILDLYLVCTEKLVAIPISLVGNISGINRDCPDWCDKKERWKTWVYLETDLRC
ncbi:MAG: hypothetical protein PHP50_13710, partial [Lachnospiraceae bacterium]|nr:hypothetical protein [Lachnospiraceae bacterium]